MSKKNKKLGQVLEESGYKTYNMEIEDNRIDLATDNYVLVREEDNKQIRASEIKFIEWNEDGRFRSIHDEPAIGRSIIADPQRMSYSWLTTTITEIKSPTHLITKNSTYKIYKLL